MNESKVDSAPDDPLLGHPNYDRRRPGRMEDASPALIQMLRRPSEAIEANFDCDDDSLRTAHGIINAALISAVIWGLIIGVAWAAWW
jgi:hypothetical protein